MLQTLKTPPNETGILYDTGKPYLLCASLYSDKTNIGNNLNAYPLHLVVGNWGLSEVNRLLSTNAGLLAYMPILPENNTISVEAMTQLRSEFMQICLDVPLRYGIRAGTLCVHTTALTPSLTCPSGHGSVTGPPPSCPHLID